MIMSGRRPLTVALICFGALFWACNGPPEKFSVVEAMPHVYPDVAGATIPVNIAPLNFLVRNKGDRYTTVISGKEGGAIMLGCRDGAFDIPLRKWKKMLRRNAGNDIRFEVYVRDSGAWKKFSGFICHIAPEPVDPFLVYRLIGADYRVWKKMGIYQRNLESFDERPILENRATEFNCVNCHSFCGNDPGRMLIHLRKNPAGTIIVRDGAIARVNTATDRTLSAAVYPAWHPGGRFIAFSVNTIFQEFHALPTKSITVFDRASDLIVYDIEKNLISTSPKVATGLRETLPCWSPDGRYLYFCRAGRYGGSLDNENSRYDLMRVACDPYQGAWGKLDTLIDSRASHWSVTFPRVSPDNRYLLFCRCASGYFAIHDASSDLCLLDLKTMGYRPLDSVNSDYSESHHSFSSNSRWFVFASKRENQVYSRLYLAYLDSAGAAHKPFVLPQEKADYYSSCLLNYNVPELIVRRCEVPKRDLLAAAHGKETKALFDPAVDTAAPSAAALKPR